MAPGSTPELDPDKSRGNLTYRQASESRLKVSVEGVALITGAGRGIGKAMAIRFAQAGFAVGLVARSGEQIEETRVEVENNGGDAFSYVDDVADPHTAERIVEDIRKRFGRLDVLINNAGICIPSSIETMPVEDYYRQNRVNLDGVFFMTHFAWPLLRESSGGVVINISSKAAQDPYPGLEIYGGTKACVNAWTVGWAREGAKCNIRVYSIGPGATDTVMLRQIFPNIPPTATISPDDVAELAFTLAGPAGKFISGTTIYIGK